MYEKPRIRKRRVCNGVNINMKTNSLERRQMSKIFLLHTMVSQCLVSTLCTLHNYMSKLFSQTLMIQSMDKQNSCQIGGLEFGVMETPYFPGNHSQFNGKNTVEMHSSPIFATLSLGATRGFTEPQTTPQDYRLYTSRFTVKHKQEKGIKVACKLQNAINTRLSLHVHHLLGFSMRQALLHFCSGRISLCSCLSEIFILHSS